MNVVLYYFRNLCFKGYIDPVRFDSHVFCEVGTVLGSRVARMEKMGNFLFRFFFFHLFILVGGELLYNIVVVFAIH